MTRRVKVKRMTEQQPNAFQDRAAFKEAREKLNLSQAELSDAMGLKGNRGSIYQLEAGLRDISGPLSRLMWFFMTHGIPKVFLPTPPKRKDKSNETL